MESLFWTGYYNAPRHAAINDIQMTVLEYGDIIDFKFFSDISMSLEMEVMESNIDKLYGELSKRISMDFFDHLNSNSLRERTIYLNVSFAKGTGDLKTETPSIPG